MGGFDALRPSSRRDDLEKDVFAYVLAVSHQRPDGNSRQSDKFARRMLALLLETFANVCKRMKMALGSAQLLVRSVASTYRMCIHRLLASGLFANVANVLKTRASCRLLER